MTREAKIGAWFGVGLLVAWAIVTLCSGCQWWVYEVRSQFGPPVPAWSTTKASE